MLKVVEGVELHCSGHFFINAANKAIAHHLMRRQHATSHWKLPLLSMNLSPPPILPTWSSQETFVSSPPLFKWIPSLGTWCLNNKTNSSTIPSSVLGPPYIYIYIYLYIYLIRQVMQCILLMVSSNILIIFSCKKF